MKYCLEKTIDSSYQLNRTKLEKCTPLLIRFLESNVDLELQSLHVITRKIVELEHPSGCLHEILTCLYDNFALSEAGFFKWLEDNDPLEQEGKGKINEALNPDYLRLFLFFKGVALKSCTKFIEFLNATKDEDSTEDEN